MNQHQFGAMDRDRVQTCTVCGVQQTPSVGPLRSFGWRRKPSDRWQLGMLPCEVPKVAQTA